MPYTFPLTLLTPIKPVYLLRGMGAGKIQTKTTIREILPGEERTEADRDVVRC